MPVAGTRAADRAKAHYRWAARYTEAGDTPKGLAHFGRALDFGGFDHQIDSGMRLVVLCAERAAEAWSKPAETHGVKIFFAYRTAGGTQAEVAITHRSRTEADTFLWHAGGPAPVMQELGHALDKCAVKLDLNAETRVFLQSIVHEAYIFLFDDMKDGEEDRYKTRKESEMRAVFESRGRP